MLKPIDFYFDFSSPYGYLGSTRINALATAHGRSVHWHPILLGAIFKAVGNAPIMEIALKARYSWHDLARTARFHEIPFQRPPHFPLSTQAAARAMLWIQDHYGHPMAVRFAHAVYAAMFVQGVDISAVAQVLRIADVLGIDSATLAVALETPEIKEALKMEVAQAIERGVFGAPFIIVDDEAFWGFDRFTQLAAFLKNGSI
ncbi:MAG TPA: 2-hydroxychromene-2-carboxylate isomerase [Herbaspirillum sp.]|jgi:2-hydroxychromene-2-carboxylate isomerase|nr:2-hydroxychromene-2-carboxylate isomerase [Herbaspirillum sp.]